MLLSYLVYAIYYVVQAHVWLASYPARPSHVFQCFTQTIGKCWQTWEGLATRLRGYIWSRITKYYDSSKISSSCNNCTLFRSMTVESKLTPVTCLSVTPMKFYFLNDIIGHEQEVKQVQTSCRFCLIHRVFFRLLVMATAVLSSEKVNNNGYEWK